MSIDIRRTGEIVNQKNIAFRVSFLNILEAIWCAFFFYRVNSVIQPFLAGKLAPPERQDFDMWAGIFLVGMGIMSYVEGLLGEKGLWNKFEVIFFIGAYPLYTAIQGLPATIRNKDVNEYNFVLIVAAFFAMENIGVWQALGGKMGEAYAFVKSKAHLPQPVAKQALPKKEKPKEKKDGRSPFSFFNKKEKKPEIPEIRADVPENLPSPGIKPAVNPAGTGFQPPNKSSLEAPAVGAPPLQKKVS